VAEEIQIDRPVGARPDLGDTGDDRVVGERGAGKAPEPACVVNLDFVL
jgi:hypothetical protein